MGVVPSRRVGVPSLVLLLVLAVLTACEWSTTGHDASKTGFNPFERTIGVDNVADLQLGWSAPFVGQTAVAGGMVYATGLPTGAASDSPRMLVAFDATGVN